ncbi:SRPBCC family protein [Lichenifustis flavocetrariae]|uniref:SRPBCC family protein n=1 Tax=Lichenifustis flavocetrariae TaxID=2949735 RepID=A0AA41YWI3_9HYPH|nr:SRPBCC family protein [Lichenifustis flavocetrariae]MCW6509414.1 SRPBCC family protein [Lichenifustis flavocetrariae]
MVKIDKSTVVDAPVEQVWAVLRDFNLHDKYHPAVANSQIERGLPSDKVGCVRRFHLQDGSELRELLLTLSDADMSFSYCLLDTPVPLLNYVAHNRLIPITDGDRTFWHWHCRFDTPPGQEQALFEAISTDIYDAGFRAVRAYLGLPATIEGVS